MAPSSTSTSKAPKIVALELPQLRPARDDEAYAVHRAALEWDIEAPVIINDRDDIRSKPRWGKGFEPFDHQVKNLMTFCRRAPVALIADDVGLGKTISAGLILSELMMRNRVQRALVLCPKILLPQWQEELKTKFGIPCTYAVGQGLEEALHRNDPGVLATTYDSARSRFQAIEAASFDMMILDEAHKLRNLHGGSGKPPAFARLIREALARRQFKFVLMLTATPIHNRLWDLYSAIDCLTVAKGHENPLGTPEVFAARFLADGKTSARKLKPGRQDEFRRQLGKYMVRTRRTESGLVFPSRSVKTRKRKGHEREQELLRILFANRHGLNGLVRVGLAEAAMSSPAALVEQARNAAKSAKRTIPEDLADEIARTAPKIQVTAKARILLDLTNKLSSERPQDWRLVVFTRRKATQKALGDMLEARGIRVGFIAGSRALHNERDIRAFRADPPAVNVIISTDAGAEGVNLQCCNIIVNYDLPWNPMLVEQRIGRVQRLGSKFSEVQVLNLVLSGSVEEKVVERLIEKLQAVTDSVGDIEGILELTTGGMSRDDGIEKMIHQMVLDSLEGQDVSKSVESARASIARAKQLYEEEQELVDRQLGVLDQMHEVGPRVPNFRPATPSMDAREFVRRSLSCEDATVVERSPDTWEIRKTVGGRELGVFDHATANRIREKRPYGGWPIRVFAPGQKDFERLVGKWIREGEHRLQLLCGSASEHARVVAEWTRSLGDDVAFQDAGRPQRSATYRSTLSLLVSANVAHDQFTKLIDVEIVDRRLESAFVDRVFVSLHEGETVLATADWQSEWKADIKAAIHADDDIRGFSDFYFARLAEELERAGSDPRIRKKIREDFTPEASARLVAVSGEITVSTRFDVTLTIGGSPPLRTKLTLRGSPAVVTEPDRLWRCAASGRDLPRDLLATSQASGRLARLDLLQTSEASGRRALPDEMATCELSGGLFLATETELCAASKQRVHLSRLMKCQASGQLYLPEHGACSDVSGHFVAHEHAFRSEKPPHRVGLPGESVRCAASGLALLSDEVAESELSHRLVDRDLLHRSDASGRKALQDEMVRCEDSGVLLFPEEAALCPVTNKTVDRRLLAPSALSGNLALQTALLPCAHSGDLLLPDELELCAITNQRVSPAHMLRCAATGLRAVHTAFIRSAVSNDPVLRDQAFTSPTGSRGLPSETALCSWLGERYLKNELLPCPLTGAFLSPEARNPNGECYALRNLLDGRALSAPAPSDVEAYIAGLSAAGLEKIRRVEISVNPSGSIYAVGLHVGGVLGFGKKLVGLLLRVDPGMEVLGTPCVGRRRDSNWQRV